MDLINTYNITMIVLSTTVLMNLLVALMGSTFIRHSNLGRQMWWLEFSDLVLRYERRLSAKVRWTVHVRVQSQGFLSTSSLFLKYTYHDNLIDSIDDDVIRWGRGGRIARSIVPASALAIPATTASASITLSPCLGRLGTKISTRTCTKNMR